MLRKVIDTLEGIETSKRKLLTDSIYGLAEGTAVLSVAVYGLSKYSSLDIGLAAPAVGIWFGASLHMLYCKIQHYREHLAEQRSGQENNDPDDEAAEESELELSPMRCQRSLRFSTHHSINAVMHATVSSLFIAGDGVYLSGLVAPTASVAAPSVLAVRIAASSLWLFNSSIRLTSALAQERHQENHHDADPHLLCLDSLDMSLLDEAVFLMVGVLYTGAYSSETPINPLKMTALGLWLIANGIDVATTLAKIIVKYREEEIFSEADSIHETNEQSVIDMATLDETSNEVVVTTLSRQRSALGFSAPELTRREETPEVVHLGSSANMQLTQVDM